MDLSRLKPSDFCTFPYESVLNKTEAEIVAVNTMKIRRRLGDSWDLTKDDYVRECRRDGHSGYVEYFNEVFPLVKDAIGAISFCRDWAKKARCILKA